MKITDIFKKQKRTFSFEFYPPKNEIQAVEFGINLGQLMRLSPSFATVTYGAGGSEQNSSFDLVDFIENKTGITCMAHYTCLDATKEKIQDDLEALHSRGIENLMLLRGDPPKGQDKFKENPDGFNHASDLISFARQFSDFCIGGAAYPEKHPEAKTLERDLENLKTKVDSGAEFLITQLFFNNHSYFEFVELAKAKGINCRIIPGIIPIINFKQIKRFAQFTGAKIPESIIREMEPHQDDPQKTYRLGVEFAVEQTKELLENGAPGIHFYTLNKSQATVEIFERLQEYTKL